MYTGLPKRQRILVVATLTATWLLVAAAGFSSAFLSPRTVTAEVGSVVLLVCGSAVMTSALIAALGVAINRYRWEWAASWLTAAGVVPYVITVWWLVFSESGSRLTQAFFVTALLTFLVHRALMCAAHAAKMREIVAQTGLIPIAKPPHD